MNEAARLLGESIDRTNAQDWDGFSPLLAEGCEIHMAGSPGPLDLEEFRLYRQAFEAAFPDGHHTITELLGEGDVAATQGWFEGTHTGTLLLPQGELPPTGTRVRTAFAVLGRIRDGRFVSMHVHWDVLGFLTQLGAVPAPAAV